MLSRDVAIFIALFFPLFLLNLNIDSAMLNDKLRGSQLVRSLMGLEEVVKDCGIMMKQPTEEDEVAHYANIMEIMKVRWAKGMTPEMKEKLEAMHEDPELRKSINNEFRMEWILAQNKNDDGTTDEMGYLNKDGFRKFNRRHLSNLMSRLGWSPEFSMDISDKIWEAIYTSPTSEHNKDGISLHDFIRYHKVMKNNMHKEVVVVEESMYPHNTNAATEDDEVSHYASIIEIMKVRWAGMTPEVKEKLAFVHGNPMFRKSIKEDFMKEWREARIANGSGQNENDEDDVGFLNKAGFRDFHERHLLNIKSYVGWSPEFSMDVSNKIWEAIYTSPWSEHNKDGISVNDFRRYQKVIKNNLHKETVKEEVDHYVKQEQAVI